ncbi:CBS domain-containing protein [Aquimarina sp. MAR_2010_214]|uniref:DUF294 nucleotidyltransferase-like domain-containing protein n=1 Tax=Aquimarina sp. MAR_2010_214 TaxID=1250026 RepID=UPI000C704A6A|nr:DUF294 nucleotidyltransferase-like domain-containing protein [Aquimarina sp. MAR_2010_214]PKV51711.1 CBS domain-containing protein [Aquimarina sp. MAR_2010_214]
MKNTIAERIFDFLKDFPPFDVLTQEQLYTISKDVKVIYLEDDTTLFKKDEKIHDHFYIVKDGAVGLFGEQNLLIDKCDEGDIFGLRAVIRKGNYLLSAKAIEESIVYSISSKSLDDIINTNAGVNKFLLASFATNIRNPYSNEHKGTLFANVDRFQSSPSAFTEVHSIQYSKSPVTCSQDITIREAAKKMTSQKVGSIIITEQNKPLGIITDKDLRTKIATGIFAIEDTVESIMSAPVITYPETISVAEAQIAMLQHKITHLCITKNGTSDSDLIGILSEHDIVVVRGNNPSALVKEVKRAKDAETLQQITDKAQQLLQGYIKQQMPIFYVSKIISALTEAITQKVITLSIAEMTTAPPTSFGWFALGSQGRQEQLLLTDQDNALVFEDVPKQDYDNTKRYFLSLSEKITSKLHTVGFEFCPAEMMASNPKWCLSVSEWKQQFATWITHPNEDSIMLCTIFFDYHLIYGNKNLADELSQHIFESIDAYEIFLNFLGLNALKNPPPLSFFKQFLVEHSGNHKDQFDIKARALMPIIDAARLLTLSHNIKNCNNTILRYEKLAEIEPQNKNLYESCIHAFKILLRFRTEQGLLHNNSGRFIDVKSLSKVERLRLKGCFKSIKDMQELIRVRFNLSQML